MDQLLTLLESSACQHLVTALLHTLWQGAVIAAILFVILARLSAKQANARYLFTVVALCGIVLSGLLTWSILNYVPSHPSFSNPPTASSTHTIEEEAQSTTLFTPPTSNAPAPQSVTKQPWQTWALGVWLMGTALMLLRMALTLVGARQLRGQCYDLEQPDILSLIESLCTQMHISHRIRVLVSEHLSVPGVIGCLWPTLLLPVCVTTGMPVDDLKAILTHELAHIKRYDYLVNVIQMVIESLLFFNPAIWWISRQIRIEREACCDAVSIAATGQRLKYAEVLVAWTAQLQHNNQASPAMALADKQSKSTVVDRIKRITLAGHHPRLNISWPMACVTVSASLICLASLWQGTNLAVAVAARILTPQERIEQLAEISKTYGYEPGRDPKENSIQVSGIIRTRNGSPLPNRINILLNATSGHNSSVGDIGANRLDAEPEMAEFHTTVAYGQFEIMVSAKGYAPAPAGPFESESGKNIENIELILDEGFTGQIKVINEAGHPIAKAHLKGGYPFKYNLSCIQSIELLTNVQGFCTQEHTSEQPMTLKVTAPGYEPRSVKSIALDPNQPFVIVLQKAKPITGTVVSKETGLPINRAEIRLLILRKTNQGVHLKQVDSDPDVFTDQSGFFQLEQVQQGWEHLVHITAQGHGHVYLEDLPAGKQDLHIELTNKKTIRGTILGDLSELEKDSSGQPVITFENEYSGYAAHHATAPVTFKEGTGEFEINDVWGQTVVLKAGYKEIKVKPEEDRLNNIVIDLRASVTRDVVLNFEIPKDSPPIQGQVRIDRIKERAGPHIRSQYPDWIDITDNQVTFKTSAPGQFKYSLDLYKKRPLGYWFKKSKYMDVTAGPEPMVINVPVYPAGAIYGKIIRADGTQAKKARASLVTVKRPDSFDHNFNNILSNSVNMGTYNATPLPLGGTYAIMAYEGYAFAMTEPFTLDQAKPIVEADLQLPRGVTVTGQLLDPEGKPATNTVSLHVSVKRGQASSGLGGAEIQPDKKGRFVFENVNPGPGGSCEVNVIGQTGFRPAKHPIKDLSKPVIIPLEKGHRVTGTVIDQATGWPVPGLAVYASAAQNAQGDYSGTWELLEAEAKTNAQGQFEFTNMGDGFYRLGTRGANMASPNIPTVVTGGQKDAVTLSVTLLPWSELKPKKPE